MNQENVFSKRLKELLVETTQEKLAEAIGKTRQAVGLYVTGKTKPDIETFVRIADYFGVSYDYLLGYSEAKHRDNVNIAEETGLSEAAIDSLRNWSSYNWPDIEEIMEADETKMRLLAERGLPEAVSKAPREVSQMLEHPKFKRIIEQIQDLRLVLDGTPGTRTLAFQTALDFHVGTSDINMKELYLAAINNNMAAIVKEILGEDIEED